MAVAMAASFSLRYPNICRPMRRRALLVKYPPFGQAAQGAGGRSVIRALPLDLLHTEILAGDLGSCIELRASKRTTHSTWASLVNSVFVEEGHLPCQHLAITELPLSCHDLNSLTLNSSYRLRRGRRIYILAGLVHIKADRVN